MRLFFPLLLVVGGAALVYSAAKADAKKKKIDEALDLGLDEEGPGELPPPPPPIPERAIPSNPINEELFSTWWYESGNPETGVMGFWTDFENPPDGTDFLGFQIPLDYQDIVITTKDGAMWYWDTGWHPATVLVYDYDTWYNSR